MTALPRRPEFHYTAASGWINDPLGLTFHGGEYHLFYQYVPGQPVWDVGCHWGHAVGADLLTWEERAVAVAPGDGDGGAWSGSIAVDPTGDATLFYTSVTRHDPSIGAVRLAHPESEDWTSWTKGARLETPTDLDFIAYRDPFVFRDGERWRMLVGAGLVGGVAAAPTFVSDNLRDWEYDGVAASRPSTETDGAWTGSMWECPQIVEIDGSHVLITSVWDNDSLHSVAYGVGALVDGRFTARAWGRLTYGDGYYAASFFRDRDGEPGLIYWVRGVGDADAGWAGALSLPHRLRLVGDVLQCEPHPDLDAYARALPHHEVEHATSAEAYLIELPQFPVEAAIEVPGASVQLLGDVGGLRIVCGKQDLVVPGADGPVTVVIDGPVIEVCTAGGAWAVGLPAADEGPVRLEDIPAEQIRVLRRA